MDEQSVTNFAVKDCGKYSFFDNDHGHTTNRYLNLEDEIKDLICKGYLC